MITTISLFCSMLSFLVHGEATHHHAEFCTDVGMRVDSKLHQGMLYSPGFPHTYGQELMQSSCIFTISGLTDLCMVKIVQHKFPDLGEGPCIREFRIDHGPNTNHSGDQCKTHEKIYKGRSTIELVFSSPVTRTGSYAPFVISYEGEWRFVG